MWHISEIKNRAHFYMNKAYWKSVLVALILSIVTGSIFSITAISQVLSAFQLSGRDMMNYGYIIGYYTFSPIARILMMVVFVVAVVLFIAVACVRIFVLSPIEVGCRRFYIINHAMPGNAKASEMFHSFSDRYINVVKTMFLKFLYTALWSLLLVFPGVIKHYAYRMVPYILAEEPGMDSYEVFRLSKEMMRGNKWHAFLLDLSFIGWRILNFLTLNLLGIFYVRPYRENANNELYITLRDQYLGRGAA